MFAKICSTGLYSQIWFNVLLTVASLAVEGFSLRSLKGIYKTRSTPSQGIALGSLTCPWLLASIAIKYSREGGIPGKLSIIRSIYDTTPYPG